VKRLDEDQPLSQMTLEALAAEFLDFSILVGGPSQVLIADDLVHYSRAELIRELTELREGRASELLTALLSPAACALRATLDEWTAAAREFLKIELKRSDFPPTVTQEAAQEEIAVIRSGRPSLWSLDLIRQRSPQGSFFGR
jgi:hypothetical protein